MRLRRYSRSRFKRGARDAELVGQRGEADAAAVADQHLDLVEAFGAVHRCHLLAMAHWMSLRDGSRLGDQLAHAVSQLAPRLDSPGPSRCMPPGAATMNAQQATLPLDCRLAAAPLAWADPGHVGFEIGWDHAQHRLTPPVEHLQPGNPLRHGLGGRQGGVRPAHAAGHAAGAQVAAAARSTPGCAAARSRRCRSRRPSCAASRWTSARSRTSR